MCLISALATSTESNNTVVHDKRQLISGLTTAIFMQKGEKMIGFINGEKIVTKSDLPPRWNLLTNSQGPFQPKNNSQDNNEVYSKTKAYLVKGETYTLSAQTNGIFTDVHDPNHASKNCTIWVTDSPDMAGGFKVISDKNTSTGTTFNFDLPTGNYYMRVNGYEPDNSTKVWNLKIEKGDFATEWMPAVSELMLKNQNGG